MSLRVIKRRRRTFVARGAAVAAFANAPKIDSERLRDDIDRALDQDATPRS